jgi:4-diphosphocytidyl-2-C-methyl-D-erythritol kinase
VKITIAAPAKVNLWLRVGPPDGSGYHPLSTLFCALDVADTVVLGQRGSPDDPHLETAVAPPLEDIPDLGPADANLAVQAARAFLQRAGKEDALGPKIRLVKRIPAGGGLGGGSSDAGAVLRAMRRLHPRSPAADEILEIAGELGSDVPFFVLGVPLAHGTGRGERLTPLPPLPPRTVVLVLPPFAVGTRDAYRWLDEDRGDAAVPPPPLDPEADLTARAALSWDDVAELATNHFEGPVFHRHPELRAVRDALRELGARPALLAGSGSTVFGVFADPDRARAAARSLRSSHPDHRVLLTSTRTR